MIHYSDKTVETHVFYISTLFLEIYSQNLYLKNKIKIKII
jgi:hypothetical protein